MIYFRRDLIEYLKGERPLPKEANMLAPMPSPIPLSKLLTDHSSEPDRKRPKLDHDKKGYVAILTG
jgi:hypothetical protein